MIRPEEVVHGGEKRRGEWNGRKVESGYPTYHDAEAMYALDVQPSGKRFATAGGGESTIVIWSGRHWTLEARVDGQVKIWKMPNWEDGSSKAEVLATLSKHSAPCHGLRWSTTGL